MSIELQSSNISLSRPPAVPPRQPASASPASETGRPSSAQGIRAEAVKSNAPSRAASAEISQAAPPSADRQVDQIANLAAERMFKGREVEVNGFLDDSSGRFVYRISDKDSGQILAQTPPDALLRFFASYEGMSEPLLTVDA